MSLRVRIVRWLGDQLPTWNRSAGERVVAAAWAAPALLIVATCCGLPCLWALVTIAGRPAVLSDLGVNGFRAALLVRTLSYNFAVAALATALGLPIAVVIGRGRGRWATALKAAIPVVLFMPLLSLEYGWLQFLRLARPLLDRLGLVLEPAGTLDLCRCVWTLAAWLWVVPALLIGLSLRQLDPAIQECALLDGAALRVTLRQILGPLVASVAIVMILASQEFAVYEPTGINVMATEVRMVFATGAFSSLSDDSRDGAPPLTQKERAAASIATATPLLLSTLLLGILAMKFARGLSVAENLHVGTWSPRLDASRRTLWLATVALAVCVGCPVVALLTSLNSNPPTSSFLSDLGSPLGGSVEVFLITFFVALLVAVSAATAWLRGLLPVAIASFLLGGELVAIVLLRFANEPNLSWARDSCALPIAAYLGRFSWIILAIVASTWSRVWRGFRDVAALEGAGPASTFAYVVWPLSWPMLLGAALLVSAFSLTEVSATATLIPQHPPVLTTVMLTWAHKAHFAPMIAASLIMIVVITMLAIATRGLFLLSTRRAGEFKSEVRRR